MRNTKQRCVQFQYTSRCLYLFDYDHYISYWILYFHGNKSPILTSTHSTFFCLINLLLKHPSKLVKSSVRLRLNFHSHSGSAAKQTSVCLHDAVRYCVHWVLLESVVMWAVLAQRTWGSLRSMVQCVGHKRSNVTQTERLPVPQRHAAVGPRHPSMPSAPRTVSPPLWPKHCKL